MQVNFFFLQFYYAFLSTYVFQFSTFNKLKADIAFFWKDVFFFAVVGTFADIAFF